MRSRTTPLAVCLVAIVAAVSAVPTVAFATAHHENQNEYLRVYERVDQDNDGPYKGGLAGRNLVTDGVKTKHGFREATDAELADSVATMRSWRHPAPTPSGSTASVPPSGGTGYAPGAPVGVIACESGGNPTIVNPTNPDRPAGLFQIITSTWEANGGTEFAPTADLASPYDQSVVAARILASAGPGAWECPGA